MPDLGRRDVRGLGVVDVDDAVDRRDLLEPVRDAGERRRAPRGRRRARRRGRGRRPRPPSRSRGCARRAGGSRRRPSAARRRQNSVPSRWARSAPGAGAERHARRAPPPSVARARAPAGTTASAPGGWWAKISQLGRAVGLERAVAVQVVLGEVEQHRGLGRERLACPRAGTTTPRRRRPRPARACPGSDASGVPTLPATDDRQPRRRGGRGRSARPWSSCRSSR